MNLIAFSVGCNQVAIVSIQICEGLHKAPFGLRCAGEFGIAGGNNFVSSGNYHITFGAILGAIEINLAVFGQVFDDFLQYKSFPGCAADGVTKQLYH